MSASLSDSEGSFFSQFCNLQHDINVDLKWVFVVLLKTCSKEVQTKPVSEIPGIWKWLLFMHYLCMCLPWQCKPRASLTLKGFVSRTESWVDCSVRIYCINMLTATGKIFFLSYYNNVFPDGLQWTYCLHFRRSCNLVCKSVAETSMYNQRSKGIKVWILLFAETWAALCGEECSFLKLLMQWIWR